MSDSHQDPQPEEITDDRVDESSNAPAIATVDDIDYSKYHRPEIQESVERILSVRKNGLYFGTIVFLAWVAATLSAVILFREEEMIWIIVIAFVAMVAGFFWAISVGAMMATRRVINEVVRLVEIAGDITSQILADMGDVREKGLALTAATVFEGVSTHVIVPTVESVIRSQLGLLAIPLMWIYRGTIQRLSRSITRAMVKKGKQLDEHLAQANASPEATGEDASAAPSAEVKAPTKSFGERVEKGAETAQKYLRVVRGVVKAGALAAKTVLLVPLFVVFALMTLFCGALGMMLTR